MTEARTRVHTVEHGEASALPENNWLWRRVYMFGVTLLAYGGVARVAERINDPERLHDVIRLLVAIVATTEVLYVTGATVEQVIRLIAALKTSRKETIHESHEP